MTALSATTHDASEPRMPKGHRPTEACTYAGARTTVHGGHPCDPKTPTARLRPRFARPNTTTTPS